MPYIIGPVGAPGVLVADQMATRGGVKLSRGDNRMIPSTSHVILSQIEPQILLHLGKNNMCVNGSSLMSPPDSFTTPQVAIWGAFVAY